MPYRVYRVRGADRARLDEALGDDVLSRQSLTLRDARHFGRAEDALYLFVEGTEAGVLRADQVLLYFAEPAADAEALYGLLKDEEDAAASSLGSVFDAF
jgi:hypothetical protein